MPTRLMISDERLFPVQAFFDAVADRSFVRVVDSLTNGIGYSIDDVDCSFSTDLDPGEESFDGVRFSVFEATVVIPTSLLRSYLEQVCRDYCNAHPEDRAALLEFLSRPFDR